MSLSAAPGFKAVTPLKTWRGAACVGLVSGFSFRSAEGALDVNRSPDYRQRLVFARSRISSPLPLKTALSM
jgi:hypothetical protein